MFYISLTKNLDIKKDLKIIINFKKSSELKTDDITEIFANKSDCCLISKVIAQNIENDGKTNIFKYDISLRDDQNYPKNLFISLIASIFNNDPIKYTNDNQKILLEIAKLFSIDKLQKSIERYSTYVDQINEFSLGRLPLIDEEFLCQLYLLDLTESNIEDTQKACRRFIESITVETFGQILYRCIYSRLSNSPLYLTFIVKDMVDYYPEFLKTLERNFRFCSFVAGNRDDSLQTVNFLFRYFLENGLVKYEDVESLSVHCGSQSYTYQYFDHEDGNIHYDASLYIYRHYDEISKDNYSLHRQLVLNGRNQDPLFQIIEKDDIESFVNYMSLNPEENVDRVIEKCYYESRSVFAMVNHSLIEIAAYFGSVNIFKYLILNNALIQKDTLREMAIYSGNPEIIRICKQKDISFKAKRDEIETSLQIAIKMNHFDIIRWLLEEEKVDIYFGFDPINYALNYSNFYAFYYLIRARYDYSFLRNSSDENEEENEECNNEKATFEYDFKDDVKELIVSYNIPILKNYLTNFTNVDLNNYEDDFFLDYLLINYDCNIIEILLEKNKIKNLSSIPYHNATSKTYQNIGHYLITHPNVYFTQSLIYSLNKDLLEKKESIANDLDFIKEQIQILYDSSDEISVKLALLPTLFEYNFFKDNFSQQYKKLLLNYKKPLPVTNKLFELLIYHVSPRMLELILLKTSEKDRKKLDYHSYTLSNLIKDSKLDMVIFLMSTNYLPSTSKIKFDGNQFFQNFYALQTVEDMKKFVEFFNKKNERFYEDEFLPNVLYEISDVSEEIARYLFSLPEIEPFLNKENPNYKNLPPLLYTRSFKKFMYNEKVDINIRRKGTNDNLLCLISDEERIRELLSIEKFEYNIDDVMKSIQRMWYPYQKDVFEFYLNGLLNEDDKNSFKFKIKLDFNDDQINKIFNLLCIKDDRLELAMKFYNKYANRIDINYVNPSDQRYCLLDAIDCNSVKTVQYLLNFPDIDLNKRGNTGSMNTHDYLNSHNITPFCYAVECNVDEIITLFFKRKNDFDINATYTNDIFF